MSPIVEPLQGSQRDVADYRRRADQHRPTDVHKIRTAIAELFALGLTERDVAIALGVSVEVVRAAGGER